MKASFLHSPSLAALWLALLLPACSATPEVGTPTPDEEVDEGADLDADADGIPDAAEAVVGSDPASPDTDGDAIGDLEELGDGSPEAPPDCDGDGKPDILESRVEDSDGDGAPDQVDSKDEPLCPGGVTAELRGDPDARCPEFACPEEQGGEETGAEGEGEGEAAPVGEGEGEGSDCDKISDADMTCDGVDDDCDGQIDDDFVVEVCGQGACAGITRCVDAVASCDGPAPADDDRACDGVDDDCDGQIDEGYVPDASCGQGACAAAATPATCEDGVETPCTPGLPLADDDASCDGVDDDCDGVPDEDFLEIRCGVGVCAAIRTCRDGQEVCPAGAPLSLDDPTCDGVDDNCNAQPDEDYLPVPCGVGACATTTACVDGDVECDPGDPVGDDNDCNGVDDDCDGTVDEGYVGVACGVGACATVTECVDGAPACPDVDHPDTDTTCDGVDDDCDGLPDDDFQGEECGEGVCAAVFNCHQLGDGLGAEKRCPQGQPDGPDTDCDGVDDDCDGRADEDFVGTPCGQGACLTNTACVGAQVLCPEVAHPPTDLTCDNIDDDCDGTADEEYAGEACGLGACAATTVCRGGQPECPQIDPAQDDPVCDDVDDDCDGEVDEDYTGMPCGDGACAADTVCVRGRVRCPAVEHADDDRTCDGVDDDCDGIVDDDFQAVDCSVGSCQAQTSCADADPALDRPARVECVLPEHPDADLICDGFDEDCDGDVDEDWVEVPCGRPGVCAGVSRCVNDAPDCQDEGAETGPDEDCDNLDNDCDGEVDEGYVGAACQAQAGESVCNGTFQCVVGEVQCVPDGGGLDDTCDAVDDDCDGQLNEDYPADACRIGTCDGVTICEGAQVFCEQVVKDTDTTCDNCDDDNNGEVDDGFPLGDACDLDGSPCPGAQGCANGQQVCERVFLDDDTTCDLCDDDDDGDADEDYVGVACEQANGCAGLTSCSGGDAVCSAPDPGGVDTTCNGCDDDGDGSVDEDWDDSVNCTVNGCPGHTTCRNAEVVCVEGRDGLVDDDCDGCDNDGDGTADNDYANAEECVAADSCQGHWECLDRQEVCVAGGLDNDDTCDGCDDDGDGSNDENFLGGDACTTADNCAGETSCVQGDETCIDLADPPALDDDCDGVDDDCDGENDEDCAIGNRLGWATFSGSIFGTGCHYQNYDNNGWPRDTNGDNWADCINCTSFTTCGGQQGRAEVFAFDSMGDASLFSLDHAGLSSLDGMGGSDLHLAMSGLTRVEDAHCTFNDARGSKQFAGEWEGGSGTIGVDGGADLVDLSNIKMAWFYEDPNDCFFWGNNNECVDAGTEASGRSIGLLTADVSASDNSPHNLARDLGARIVMQIGVLNPPNPFGHCTQAGGQNLPCNGQGVQHPCVRDCAYAHHLEVRVLAADHGEDLPTAGLELAPYGNRSNVGIVAQGSNADLDAYEGDDMWKLPQGGWFAVPAQIPSDSSRLQFRYGLLYDEDRSETCMNQCGWNGNNNNCCNGNNCGGWNGNHCNNENVCNTQCGACNEDGSTHPVVDDYSNSQVAVSFNSCAANRVVETHEIKWCSHAFVNAVQACSEARNLNQQCNYTDYGCSGPQGPCNGGMSWEMQWSQCKLSQGTDANGSAELHLADHGPAGGCGQGNEVTIDDMEGRAGYFLFRFENGNDVYENMMVDDLNLIP